MSCNEFNPTEQPTGRRLGISVEDVSAYVGFIKSTVGITHEDELIKAIEILARKVHPLALGNVERFLSQSRMIAKKILRTHMRDEDEHTINEIVENMASKLYFHGHPINRQEAKTELRLKVISDLPPGLESALWDLYKEYDTEFDNQSVFHPQGDLATLSGQTGTLGGQTPGQIQPPAPVQREYDLVHAMIESARVSSRHTTHRRYTLLTALPGQQAIQEDILTQGWTHSPVPGPAAESPQHSTSPAGAQGASGT